MICLTSCSFVETVHLTGHMNTNINIFVPSQPSDDRDAWQHLVDLTDFALTLKHKLDCMNDYAFTNFELRVGKSA